YSYQVTALPGSDITRNGEGIKFDAYGGWWDQRVVREGFDIAPNTDFEIEVKLHLVAGTGDAAWQKGGIIIGDIGGAEPVMWFSLENPVEPNNGRVNMFCPKAGLTWHNMDEGTFSVNDWQVIKVIRTGSTLTIYRNGTEINSVTTADIPAISGKVALSAEALSVQYEYLKVNSDKDDFSDLDNKDQTTWTNLDQHEVEKPKVTVWTPTPDGLNVVAYAGWNSRAMFTNITSVPESFIYEFEVRLTNPNGDFPKASIMVGELGNVVPELLVGLDLEGGNNSVVKFINGKPWIKLQSPEGEIDVKQFHKIRVTKNKDELFVYIDGNRAHYEKGDHINNIQGRLGIQVENCEADYKFVSFKEQ
ncbi:MAG: hypothetical protein KAH32_06460, partial [Chlamydiia bacterium]|nr:hypothetical protein [Chlamydiia bacterium]